MLLKTGRADRPAVKLQTYRQGDVLVQKIDKLPAEAREVECEKRIILQYGEVTGHAHAISTDTASFFTAKGERYVVTKPGGCNLVHEEHGTIELPEGVYRVVQQREYVPEAPPRDVID
jgi:RecB family endonuclease NucS